MDGIRSHDTPSLSLVVKSGQIQLFTGTESLEQVCDFFQFENLVNFFLKDGANVNDNEWHVIDIKFNRGSVSLKLDDFIEDYVSSLTLM